MMPIGNAIYIQRNRHGSYVAQLGFVRDYSFPDPNDTFLTDQLAYSNLSDCVTANTRNASETDCGFRFSLPPFEQLEVEFRYADLIRPDI